MKRKKERIGQPLIGLMLFLATNQISNSLIGKGEFSSKGTAARNFHNDLSHQDYKAEEVQQASGVALQTKAPVFATCTAAVSINSATSSALRSVYFHLQNLRTAISFFLVILYKLL